MYNDRHIFEREKEFKRNFHRRWLRFLHCYTKSFGHSEMISNLKIEIRKKLLSI